MRHARIAAGLSLALAALAACGTEPSEEPAPAGGGAELLVAPPEGQGVQLRMQVELAPGEESTFCQYVALPDSGLAVTKFEHAYSEGSHHLLLYRTTLTPADLAERGERFECGSTLDLAFTGVTYAAQVPADELAFPEGVAMRFAPGEVVLVQSHYLNPTPEPLEADVRLNLWTTDAAVQQEAGTLFFYNWAIHVPGEGAASARMSCAIPEDVTLLFAMSHMHKRGVGYRSWVKGGDLAEPREIFSTDRWEDVEPAFYDPPLAVAGGQRIDFECDFVNDSADPVIEGPSAKTNEMCMFIATNNPKLDDSTENCRAVGSGPVFQGTQTCAEALGCSREAADDLGAEICLVDTCSASSQPLADFGQCMFEHCNVPCATGEGCDVCIAENCLEAYLACDAATCG